MVTTDGIRVIVVPTRDNAGRDTVRVRREIERDLLEMVGGFTALQQRGAWVGQDGKVYRDRSVRFEVACDRATDARLRAKLADWCERLGQLALYSTWLPAETLIVVPVADVSASELTA